MKEIYGYICKTRFEKQGLGHGITCFLILIASFLFLNGCASDRIPGN